MRTGTRRRRCSTHISSRSGRFWCQTSPRSPGLEPLNERGELLGDSHSGEPRRVEEEREKTSPRKEEASQEGVVVAAVMRVPIVTERKSDVWGTNSPHLATRALPVGGDGQRRGEVEGRQELPLMVGVGLDVDRSESHEGRSTNHISPQPNSTWRCAPPPSNENTLDGLQPLVEPHIVANTAENNATDDGGGSS
ncbi:hypothetical protein E2C01_080306 [Portunus trituberculatus]|uniref:Uncharacterized protein n=1 Tax=Portunus trituberculatus TaxID=210409 RepID=A0A5B7IV26_PORTR|nr:hypothetical protein [Portunus trituberculatus]